jgi:hypothetical protein
MTCGNIPFIKEVDIGIKGQNKAFKGQKTVE